MDQVSLPMRIALMVVLAFAGLWFVALRPKPPIDEAAPPPAPAPKTANAEASAPTGKAPAKPAVKPAAKPATPPAPTSAATEKAPAVPASPADRVLADLDAKRTAVLLFWDRRGADDREVRRVVSGIDRHDGKVRVHVQPITKVGDFEPITRGVPVLTSPTVLVIGADRRARAVSGLTVTRELDELVDKALAGK